MRFIDTYAIDDGHGNAITTGLQASEAVAAAQRIATERSESVYLYRGTEQAEEIRPLRQYETFVDYESGYPERERDARDKDRAAVARRFVAQDSPIASDNFEARVRDLREEAASAGDTAMVADCDLVIASGWSSAESVPDETWSAACRCASAMEAAAAMDDGE